MQITAGKFTQTFDSASKVFSRTFQTQQQIDSESVRKILAGLIQEISTVITVTSRCKDKNLSQTLLH